MQLNLERFCNRVKFIVGGIKCETTLATLSRHP